MRLWVTRSPLSWLALILGATLLAGCGGETPPVEAAPELADRLTLVDRAVASGDETSIRRRVNSLVAATEAARDDGSIDETQADRILAAAEALLARLPAPEQSPEPSASPPSPSVSSPSPEDGDEGEDDESDDKDEDEKGGDEGEGGGSGSDKGKGNGKGKGKGPKG